MLSPEQFVCGVLPFGATTVICHPHEIAKVAGLAGIKYFLEETEDLPVRFCHGSILCSPLITWKPQILFSTKKVL